MGTRLGKWGGGRGGTLIDDGRVAIADLIMLAIYLLGSTGAVQRKLRQSLLSFPYELS